MRQASLRRSLFTNRSLNDLAITHDQSVTFAAMSGYNSAGNRDSPSIVHGALPWLSIVIAAVCQFTIAQLRIESKAVSASRCQISDACRILAHSQAKDVVVVDLANQAGQLVVPATHGSGRFAAWFLADCGTEQLGLVLAATVVPLIAGIATCLASTSTAAVIVVPWLAALLWWLKPNAIQWLDGCVEVTLLGPTCGLYLASLIRHHKRPGLWSWIGLWVSSAMGWTFFPLPWLIYFLPASIAWLIVAHRHDWSWHGWLILAVLIGAAPFVHSWVELARQWEALGGLMPTILECAWPPMNGPGNVLFALAAIQICLLILPCVTRTSHAIGNLWGVTGLAVAAVVVLTRVDQTSVSAIVADVWSLPSHVDGDNNDNPPFVDKSVDGSARMLCDLITDDKVHLPPPGLLNLRPSVPLLFGYPNLLELLPWSMHDGGLGGRPIYDWSDDELYRLIERWNIGWIWAVHPECIQRLERFRAAKQLTTYANGRVFKLEREHRFILKGRGNWTTQASGEIVLTDVVPEHGEVVLSLRFYRGWSVEPGHIVVEPEVDPYDPLPIMRLRLNEPTNRIVLRLSN